MAHLYLMVDDPKLVAAVAGQLLDMGVPLEQVRLFSTRPGRLPEVPVSSHRYRSPRANLWFGAFVGAAIGLAAGWVSLLLTEVDLLLLPFVVGAFAVGGALSRRWYGHGMSGELYGLDDALRRGAAVLVVDAEPHRATQIGRAVKERHRQVAVLGADTGGTPPFP